MKPDVRFWIRLLVVPGLVAIAPAGSAQTVIPYEAVGIGGSNNVYDVDLRACTLSAAGIDGIDPNAVDPVGCVDRFWQLCKDSPTELCQIRAVPAGRCAAGASTNDEGRQCQWNEGNGAFRCDLNTGVQCVADAHCPPGDTCDTDNSAGLGDDPTTVAACACTSATEQTKCGTDEQARCSDGDPALAWGADLDWTWCNHQVTSPTTVPTNCGSEGGQALSGPRSARFENAPSAVTPQRDPGLGLGTVGEIRTVRETFAARLSPADPNFGVRRLELLGRSWFSDASFSDGDVGGGSVDQILVPLPFDPPGSWSTENLIGTCTAGSNAGALCLADPQCFGGGAGSCANLVGAYDHAQDGVGFVFTTDVDPNAPSTCPPSCGLDYDHHAFEQLALEAVAKQDRRAGVQLALDRLQAGPSGRAGAGDAVTVSERWLTLWFNNDVRCVIGGDARRFDAGACASCPNALAIGRCDNFPAASIPCDPATEDVTTDDCTGPCRYCGGTHTSSDPNFGTPQALPAGYDDQAGNCAAGFDCGALDVVGRIGLLNGVTFDAKLPVVQLWTTGLARAEFLDASCPTLSGQNTCTLGQDTSGAVGIGAGGSYANGFAFPAFSSAFGGADETCCEGGSALSWAAEYAGHVPGTGVGTGEFVPGANGIPGCIGDNASGHPTNGVGAPGCDPAGGGLAPGTDNPGADDLARYSVDLDGDAVPTNASGPPRVGDPGTGAAPIPNPTAGDPSAAGPPGAADDPNAAPTLRLVTAGSIVDYNTLCTGNNSDALFEQARVWCPVRPDPADPNASIVDCWFDADEDGIDDDDDNCVGVANPSQGDADSDGVGDACDNCPTLANADQADSDTAAAAGDTLNAAGPDGVGDVCDNCTVVANAPVTPLAFQTTTGGQLDDDADGFGNHCDADFNNSDNIVNPADLALFLAANGKKRSQASACGGGPCDIYDINGVDNLINPADLTRFLELNGTKQNKKQWKKCTACPLP